MCLPFFKSKSKANCSTRKVTENFQENKIYIALLLMALSIYSIAPILALINHLLLLRKHKKVVKREYEIACMTKLDTTYLRKENWLFFHPLLMFQDCHNNQKFCNAPK